MTTISTVATMADTRLGSRKLMRVAKNVRRSGARSQRLNLAEIAPTINKLVFTCFFLAVSLPLMAQTPQIPTLQVCNLTAGKVVTSSGSPQVHIASRAKGAFTGTFTVTVNAYCDSNGFPQGSVTISKISMSDTDSQVVVGSVISSYRIDQITSTGTDNPTAYISGLCNNSLQITPLIVPFSTPCHFWILFAHTGDEAIGGTASIGPDIVSFLLVDRSGKRIAYGTGPVTPFTGSITVTPTLN